MDTVELVDLATATDAIARTGVIETIVTAVVVDAMQGVEVATDEEDVADVVTAVVLGATGVGWAVTMQDELVSVQDVEVGAAEGTAMIGVVVVVATGAAVLLSFDSRLSCNRKCC